MPSCPRLPQCRARVRGVLAFLVVLAVANPWVPGMPAHPAHPRLFLSEPAAEELRIRVSTSEHHREAFRLLRARLTDGVSAYDGRTGYRRSALAREAALAYRVTGDPAYADLAYTTLVASRAADEDQPDSGYGLSRAMMCLGYAIAYDWCWTAWTHTQRAEILGILRAAADAWPDFRHANVETPHRGSNWVGVTRGAEFILHLAARGDDDYGPRTDRLALCASDLGRHMRTAYGPSGWTQEGLGYLHYTFSFLGPAVLASRGTEWDGLFEQFRQIAWHRLAWHAHAFRPGQRMLQSGVGGERVYTEGFASLVFAATPPEALPAYRYFYDRHMGVRASPGDRVRDVRFDGQRAGSLWALLLYPMIDEAAVDDGPLIDPAKGAYYFRNRWQDADDILLGLMMRNDHHSHAWAQPETFGLGIMGYDATFVAGPGKERAPEMASRVLIEGIEPPRSLPGSRLIRFEPGKNGGGTLLVDGAANLGLTTARRRFTVEFPKSGSIGAILVMDDHYAARTPFSPIVQLRPGESVVASQGSDGRVPWFLLRGERGWLKAWALAGTQPALETTGPVRIRLPAGHEHQLTTVLMLGTGEPPNGSPGRGGVPTITVDGRTFELNPPPLHD